MDSVNASNSPTADDKKGGFHEEGGMWVTTTDDKVVALPAVPGKVEKPGEGAVHIDPGKSANPIPADQLKSIDGFWHVHSKGSGDHPFDQPPSKVDIQNAVAPINIVVGAADKKVYFYNNAGLIGKPMKLKDFLRVPQ